MDAFFDACVFDLMMTGNKMFVEMAASAKQNIMSMYEPYNKHYSTGRMNLTIYDSKAGYQWTQCVMAEAHSSVNLSSPSFSIIMTLIVWIMFHFMQK